jgi:quinol monooxygenase YgiN
MTTLTIVRHHVQDYAKWRQTYDAFAPAQRAAGVLEESVYQDKDDPNEVLVLHRFGDRDKADAFLASAELREAMKSAGVIGQPRIEQFEAARAGVPSA